MDQRHSPAAPNGQEETLRPQNPPLIEFITIMASLMAVTALSIDIMLPALPAIAAAYGLEDPNSRQLVVTTYVLGFALGQLIYGPLSDSYGRKPVLLVGLTVFAIASIATLVVQDFTALLLARALQGIGGGAPRVIAIAIIRDLYSGRQMARIMSFIMTIFVIIPVIAPSIGEGLIQAGHWSWIFAFLGLIGVTLIGLTLFRLRETHPASQRNRFSAAWLGRAVKKVVTTRITLGYTIATGMIFGCLMAYINTAEQIFVGVYNLGSYFPLVFGSIAFSLAIAAILNARAVERLGMRCLSRRALIGFALISFANLILALFWNGIPPLTLYCVLLASSIFCFGFIMPNFNALSMEPLEDVAGTASSFIGFFTTGAGAVFGWIIGQQFSGNVVPLLAGHLCLTLSALAITHFTDKGANAG